MNIERRLWIITGSTLIFCAALMAIFLAALRVRDGHYQRAILWTRHSVVEHDIQSMADLYYKFLQEVLSGEVAEIKETARIERDIRRHLAESRVLSMEFDAAEQDEEREMASALEGALEAGGRAMSLYLSGRKTDARKVLESRITPRIRRDFALRIQARIDEEKSGAIEWQRKAQAVTRLTDAGSVATILLLTIFLVAMTSSLARYFSRSIKRLEDGLRAVSEGRLNYSIIVESDDEIGRLSRHFNLMRETLSRKEAALKKSTEQIIQSEKMAAIGQLCAGVAHDFNNLLTAIMGSAGFLLSGLPAGSELRRDAEEIKAAGNRAAALTRQLLAFSRRQVVKAQLIDFDTVLSGLKPVLQRLISEEIDLRFDLRCPDVKVLMDPTQLEQVLLNLVVNARDAIAAAGQIAISTSLRDITGTLDDRGSEIAAGSYVVVSVADTGKGMDKSTLARIFEPYFTTKEVGRGTGLGLATVYGIVKQNGGAIHAYSEEGQGSVFKIFMPLASDAAGAESPRRTAAPVFGGTETVLVVEDDASVRKFAVRCLIQGGYTVLEAEGPKAAESVAQNCTETIHLLLSDVVMPGMRGPDLARRLCSARPGMKAVFMSGYPVSASRANGTESLMDKKWIEKPMTRESLLRHVREALDGGDYVLKTNRSSDLQRDRG